MKINADWHKNNRMPKNPTPEEKILWHIAHGQNCNCRAPSPKLLEEIKNYQKIKK
jgi:histidinol phosphatase-like enzyme